MEVIDPTIPLRLRRAFGFFLYFLRTHTANAATAAPSAAAGITVPNTIAFVLL